MHRGTGRGRCPGSAPTRARTAGSAAHCTGRTPAARNRRFRRTRCRSAARRPEGSRVITAPARSQDVDTHADRTGPRVGAHAARPGAGGWHPRSAVRSIVVGVPGFEPGAFRSQSGRATKLRHTPRRGQGTAAPPEVMQRREPSGRPCNGRVVGPARRRARHLVDLPPVDDEPSRVWSAEGCAGVPALLETPGLVRAVSWPDLYLSTPDDPWLVRLDARTGEAVDLPRPDVQTGDLGGPTDSCTTPGPARGWASTGRCGRAGRGRCRSRTTATGSSAPAERLYPGRAHLPSAGVAGVAQW